MFKTDIRFVGYFSSFFCFFRLQAFVQTWVAACHYRGRARVLIPPGIYKLGPVTFAGPCSGPGPMVVHVQGTLKADTDISLYDEPQWFLFEAINGLVVIGSGTFDGQGESAWKYNNCQNNNDCVPLPSVSLLSHILLLSGLEPLL